MNMDGIYHYFKFRPINKYFIESLVRPSLYFAKPDSLNDPFDCRLDIRKSFERAVTIAQGKRKHSLQAALRNKELLENFTRQFKDFGVCSFSLLRGSFDVPLLWSHYADGHKGVCLLYRFTEEFLDNPKEIIGVDKVKYGNNILTNWLIDSHIEPDENGFVIELIKFLLTAKSEDWKYENEARIIRSTHGNFDIPRGCLEQVCFGLRTLPADVDLVIKLAKEYCGCNSFHRITHADTDFGITTIEL